ncbi:MAG: hypothetical protein AAGF57_16325 [Pseudomonadota bacterium]
MFKSTVLALSLSLGSSAALAIDSLVSTTSTKAEFTDAFCASDRTTQHIFVLPMSVFTEGGDLVCPSGTSTLRMSEPADDPGHAVLNIDPPAGVADGFDCDGKADKGMSLVAVNCLPQNLESSDHTKS